MIKVKRVRKSVGEVEFGSVFGFRFGVIGCVMFLFSFGSFVIFGLFFVFCVFLG